MLLVFLVGMLVGGCGTNLEQKIEAVREKKVLAIQDVADLIQLEGMDIQKQTPSAAFVEKWPDTVIYKVDGKNLLLVQSFEEELWKRDSIFREIGWKGDDFFELERAADVVKQAMTDNPLKFGEYRRAEMYRGKNIVAWYVVSGFSMEQVASESIIKSLGWRHMGQYVYYMNSRMRWNEITATMKTVEHVFQSDINDLKTEQFEKKGENFIVHATVNHYETPVTVGAYTMYEYYLDAQFEVQVTEALLEQYRGQEIHVSVKGPLQGSYRTHGASLGTALNERNIDEITFGGEYGVGGEPCDDTIGFEVTVAVGDMAETIIVENK